LAFGYEPDWPFTVGWAVCGIFALIFITQAFPDVWNFTFWLAGIYVLSSLSMFAFLVFSDTYGTAVTFIGILAEVTSIGLAFYLILHFKKIRDEVSGITRGSAERDRVFLEERYIPLGLWALSVLLFWLFTNLSIWGWFRWADSGGSIAGYIGAEILILFLGLYILWVPQTNFRWSAAVKQPSTLARPLKSIVVNRIPRTIIKSETARILDCPICGHDLNIEKRSCPNCDNIQNFYWCPRSEVFIKRCSYCSKTVSYKVTECPSCNRSLSNKATCSRCSKMNFVRDWKRQ
jgi:hypothetical protein